MQLLTSLSTRGKILLGATALGFLLVAFMLVKVASKPSYTQVMAGVDPAQTAKITAALDSKGVGYEIQNNGTAIAVKSGDVAQARIALATQGLSGGALQQPGFELLDKQKLGASNFQQQIAYQRALEGQIAQTVDQIDGVTGAQVQLTLSQDQLFADEQRPATAAVLLGGGPTTLDGGAIRGIANLVASSVPGLKTQNVTITDGSGTLLWPAGDGSGGDALTSKPAAEARYDAQLEATLNAMLVQTLGPGKAQVQVHSDLNVDQATKDQLQYATKGVPIHSQTDTETLKGTGGTAGGTAGTAGNIPSYAQTAVGATGRSNYKHTVKSTDWGVDKTVTRTKVAPGAVNRLDVALVVDKSIPPATVASLKAAVASAAGVQTGRGDTLAVSQVAFAKQPTAVKPSALPINPLGLAKYVGAGLLGLLFLFFVTRQIRKRESEAFAEEPAWLRQLTAPRPSLGPTQDEMERIDEFDAEAAARAVFARDPQAIALDDLINREPEKVAQQLRTWITEEGS